MLSGKDFTPKAKLQCVESRPAYEEYTRSVDKQDILFCPHCDTKIIKHNGICNTNYVYYWCYKCNFTSIKILN